ncbi:uncharacterized protein LOC117112226 [Anneissia japonica]|uniref:uncharacterized protein LOC117112226 n=1 Tax=Anneissia japonica TaxID=1529436 RepID=UPI00142574FB|nr:uncharacterized protein LOC117112226 [Anneissia japonica]
MLTTGKRASPKLETVKESRTAGGGSVFYPIQTSSSKDSSTESEVLKPRSLWIGPRIEITGSCESLDKEVEALNTHCLRESVLARIIIKDGSDHYQGLSVAFGFSFSH